MKEDVTRRIFLNTLYNYAGSIGYYIVSFFTLVFLTRNLSVAQFGQYNLILSTQLFFALVLGFGIPPIILRFVPEFIVSRNYKAARNLILVNLGITFLFGALISCVAYVLAQNFSYTINKIFIAEYLLLCSILGFLQVGVQIYDAAFCAIFKQGFRILFWLFSLLLELLLFVLSIKLGFGLIGVIISIAIAEVFLIIAYFIRIELYFNRLLKQEATQVDINKKRLFRYGVKEYITKFLSFFWDTRIDAYFITFYLGTQATGIFYLAVNMATQLAEYMPGAIMRPISQALFTRQYAKYGSEKELAYLFKLSNKLMAFFVFPVFVGIILLIDKIIFLLFPNYTEAIRIFYIVFIFMLFSVFLIPLRNIVTTLEKSEISVMSNLVILYKIPMVIFLTKNFGLPGTAFAAGSSIFMFFIIHQILIKRYIKIRYPWGSFFRIAINTIITAISILALRPFVTNIFTLFIVVLISAFVYLFVSFLNKVFNEYDRQLINKPFYKTIWPF